MKLLNKKNLIYGSLALLLLGGTGAYLYAKEQEEKMVIKYIDPFEYFDKMNERFFNDPFFTETKTIEKSFKIDLKENEKEYILDAELPEVKKEDIKVNYENGYLIILVSSDNNKEEKNENYIKKERNFSEKVRSFYLPNVKKDEIKAKLENGVLKLVLPKGEKTDKSTSIKID